MEATIQRTAIVTLNPSRNEGPTPFRYIVRVTEHNGHGYGKLVAVAYLDDAADIDLFVGPFANMVEYLTPEKVEVDAERFYEIARREEARNPKSTSVVNFHLNRR